MCAVFYGQFLKEILEKYSLTCEHLASCWYERIHYFHVFTASALPRWRPTVFYSNSFFFFLNNTCQVYSHNLYTALGIKCCNQYKMIKLFVTKNLLILNLLKCSVTFVFNFLKKVCNFVKSRCSF